MTTRISRRSTLAFGITSALLATRATLPAQAATGAKEHTVRVKKLPKTIQEFIKTRDRVAVTPQGGAAMFVVAAILYSQDEKLGLAALTTMIESKWLSNGSNGYKGKQPGGSDRQRFKDRWSKARKKDHVPRSYVQGTSPENAYSIPSGELVFKVREQTNSRESESNYKVFVHSTGAATPRPIRVKKNSKGIWKGSEWSSLTSGIKPPVAAPEDEL